METMDLMTVKNFCRIDDDDDINLQLMVDAAKEYVVEAIGENVNFESPRVKMLILNIVSSLYENRQITIDKSNEKMQYSLRNMVLQLQINAL